MQAPKLYASAAALMIAAAPVYALAADVGKGVEANPAASEMKQSVETQPATGAETVDRSASPTVSMPTPNDAEAASDAASMREVDADDATATWRQMDVSELQKMDIVDARGEKVGTVDAVLAGPDGAISAVTTDVGGFLGIGGTEVVIDLSQVELVNGQMMTRMTEEEIEHLPRWERG